MILSFGLSCRQELKEPQGVLVNLTPWSQVKTLLLEIGVKRIYILLNGEKFGNTVAWGNVENRFPGRMLKLPVDFVYLHIKNYKWKEINSLVFNFNNNLEVI